MDKFSVDFPLSFLLQKGNKKALGNTYVLPRAKITFRGATLIYGLPYTLQDTIISPTTNVGHHVTE